MRHLQMLFCGVALVASLVALAQHLGFDLWGCASCSVVKTLPISSVLAWAGPVAIGGLLFGIAKETKWAAPAVITAACGSVALVIWMVANRSVCLVCVVVHIGVISSALTLVPKASLLAPAFFACALVFTVTDGWSRFTVVQGVGIFRPRSGEEIPEGKVYVLFTDPECSRCRMAEMQIAKLATQPNLLHRWTILPQSAYRSMRAAAMLEMARITRSPKADALRSELATAIPPLTDEVLLAAAEKAGVRAEAQQWLQNPVEDALVAIQADQDTSQELQIESLPALAELLPPDASGMRTLRRVPFSAIGIGQ